MSYGPKPWQQTQWDWRAAGNFVGGGMGGGLMVLAVASGAQGAPLAALLIAGLALVGIGLLCVWFEIGRPLRALHVFFNPRTSWMTREALLGALLFPVGLCAAIVAARPQWFTDSALLAPLVALLPWTAALLALAFVYAQARIVQAAKGIPAWREPRLVPLLLLTGLAEGGGLLLLARPDEVAQQPALLWLVAGLILARPVLWLAYRRRLRAPTATLAALEAAGLWLHGATVLALVAMALVTSGWVGTGLAQVLLGLAGALTVLSGAWFKFTLITRAGLNQGFALTHWPVRGRA